MTEFKQGDRVTHAESGFWPDTYTVVRFDGPSGVKVTGPSGQRLTFTASNLTKVDDDRKPAVKVGDRVLVHQAAAIVSTFDKPVLATVVKVDVGQKGRIAVESDEKPHGIRNFYADAWSVVDDKPKVGDRVRLVHEGIVTAVTGIGSGRCLGIDGEARLLGKGETVEVLKRAPKAYAPGTVAVFSRYPHLPLVRDVDCWRTRDGGKSITNDGAIRSDPEWKTIYEPATA